MENTLVPIGNNAGQGRLSEQEIYEIASRINEKINLPILNEEKEQQLIMNAIRAIDKNVQGLILTEDRRRMMGANPEDEVKRIVEKLTPAINNSVNIPILTEKQEGKVIALILRGVVKIIVGVSNKRKKKKLNQQILEKPRLDAGQFGGAFGQQGFIPNMQTPPLQMPQQQFQASNVGMQQALPNIPNVETNNIQQAPVHTQTHSETQSVNVGNMAQIGQQIGHQVAGQMFNQGGPNQPMPNLGKIVVEVVVNVVNHTERPSVSYKEVEERKEGQLEEKNEPVIPIRKSPILKKSLPKVESKPLESPKKKTIEKPIVQLEKKRLGVETPVLKKPRKKLLEPIAEKENTEPQNTVREIGGIPQEELIVNHGDSTPEVASQGVIAEENNLDLAEQNQVTPDQEESKLTVDFEQAKQVLETASDNEKIVAAVEKVGRIKKQLMNIRDLKPRDIRKRKRL